MALRALQELQDVADDLDAEAEALERFSAARRGDNEAERDALVCRFEAGEVRREVRRFGR